MVLAGRTLLTVLLILGFVLDSPSAAKEGIRARLLSPIPTDVPAGAKLDVAWTLRTVDGGPLGASGFFVRVTGRPGSTPREADAVDSGGSFRAFVIVPPDGIKKIEIGLRGWRQMEKDGPSEPAPVFFPIEGQIFREPADAALHWPMLLLTIPLAGVVWWLRRVKQKRDYSPRLA